MFTVSFAASDAHAAARLVNAVAELSSSDKDRGPAIAAIKAEIQKAESKLAETCKELRPGIKARIEELARSRKESELASMKADLQARRISRQLLARKLAGLYRLFLCR